MSIKNCSNFSQNKSELMRRALNAVKHMDNRFKLLMLKSKAGFGKVIYHSFIFEITK